MARNLEFGDIVNRLRRTPPRRLPGKLARLAAHSVRSSRVRHYTIRRGELTDAAFLRGFDGR
ncbi:MAG: hypothetical protein JO023_28295, partial [Chloroflexi bacterium]|nr:hypothetical protein [Chloroflexota bacterium]